MCEDKKSCITINCGCCGNSNGNGNSGSDGTPVGTVISYMGMKAPKHYLACDGAIYNIADYKEFSDFIKEEYGAFDFFGGDGTATFAVPDLRGEFLRGTGTASRNSGTGLNVGVHQESTKIPSGFLSAANKNLYVSNDDTINYVPENHDSITQHPNGRTAVFKPSWTETEKYSDLCGLVASRPTNTSVLYCIKYE